MRVLYQPVRFMQAFGSSLLVLALGVVLMLVFDPTLSAFGNMGWVSIPYGVGAGGLGYAVIFMITKVFLIRINSMRELMAKLSSLFRNFTWPSIVIISIMAGLSEELLLRGVLQNKLVDWLNPTAGVVLASLVFGLMHFLSFTYVVVTFLLGLMFGLAYYFSESLAFVIVAHAVYDMFAFAVLVKYPQLLNLDRN